MKRIVATIFFLCFSHAHAQKTIVHKNENWLHGYLNIRVYQRIGVSCDLGYRFKDFFEGTTQSLIRGAGIFYFTDNTYLHVGLAYFHTYPALNNSKGLVIPELRPYQRLFINNTKGRFNISQRYRLEERFIRQSNSSELLNGYRYNYRFGYQINVQFPFVGKTISAGKLYAMIYDEVFVNFGKQIFYNYFDQNRLFVGLGYQMTKQASVSAGYQYIWQQTSTGNKFNSIDCARVSFIYNIDLRKEEKL